MDSRPERFHEDLNILTDMDADLQVDLIKDANRFVLTLATKPEAVVRQRESLRQQLQQATSHIAIIETIRSQLVRNGAILNFNEEG